MKEKNIQTLFSKVDIPDGVYELKLSKLSSMSYSAVKEHQIKGLRDAKSESGIFHKISDMPIFAGSKMRFNIPKPFDCLKISNANAYIAICYYIPRKPKEVICIDVDRFVDCMNTDSRKSLTKEKAIEISSFIIKI